MTYVRSEISKARSRERCKEWTVENRERKAASDKEWSARNKEKRRESSRRWKQRNREHVLAKASERKRRLYAENPVEKAKVIARGKAWRAKNREAIRIKKLLDNYGISLETYQSLLAKSDGRCEVCRKPQQGSRAKHLFIDHNHATGEIRGLLCHHCNMGIGNFRDSPDLLRQAIQYLHRDQHGHNVGAV